METKKRIPLSYNNNIQRNLFPKTHSFTENKKYSSKERAKNVEEAKTKPKLIKSLIYYHKIPTTTIENKKENSKTQISIDSRSEARLPKGYVDLSYDNPKNE